MKAKKASYQNHPLAQSVDVRKYQSEKYNNTSVTCTSKFPILQRKAVVPIQDGERDGQRHSEPILPVVFPKRLVEAQQLYEGILRNKERSGQSKELTLLQVKRELMNIIECKRKQAVGLRNSEIKVKWQVYREARLKTMQQIRKSQQQSLKFNHLQKKRQKVVLMKRKQQQQQFLGVGKRGLRSVTSTNSNSIQFLEEDIHALRSKLRQECINVMRSKDSFNSMLYRTSNNPEFRH